MARSISCLIICPSASRKQERWVRGAANGVTTDFALRFHDLEFYLEQGTESYAESLSYFPVRPEFKVGPEAYLEHISQAKSAVDIPIIGSLNGSTFGGWLAYARQIEEAGADALELNIYSIPSDPDISGEDIEVHYLTILASIKAQLKIPVAMKLSPFFTNFARFARRADREGANALVLFNRFYQPDIELETLEISPNILLSTPMAMRLPMRWIAMAALVSSARF